jgi:hypothetical protein
VAGRDICTKDISRIRGGWAIQDVFYVSICAEPGHLIMQVFICIYDLYLHCIKLYSILKGTCMWYFVQMECAFNDRPEPPLFKMYIPIRK